MKKLLLLLPILAIQACTVYGLTDDYGKLTTEQKATIVDADFSEKNIEKVYKVTGKELASEVKKHPKALVYVFTNGCTSDHCKPMAVYESFAKKNGYALFLVMSGYGHIEKTLAQRDSFDSQLYAVKSE
ncbi:MAG: hypothetical protein EOP06_31450, partial [Proteobacteria bacterium]